MVDEVEDAVALLGPVVSKLGDELLDGTEAVWLVNAFAQAEKLCAAGRALAMAEVARSDAWVGDGAPSPAAWMAAKAGIPLSVAIATMETVRHLKQLPAVAEAFRAGRLSLAQGKEITAAAKDCPEDEEELLDLAGRSTLAELREACRRVRAAAVTDPAERQEKIRKSRYLHSWTDHDGALRIDARLTPDDGAVVLAALDARSHRLRSEARARGDYENALAYEADALVELARADGGDGPGGPGAMVHVHVDHSALLRGFVVDGERCEVPGVGPVPVAVVRRLLSDCILKVIVTNGVDVTAVAHAGKTIPAHLRSALEARDPTCVVPGCDVRRDLQIDHTWPWIEGGPTSLDNLARLCRWHHYQKSHFGYRYRGGPGTWEWIPPEVPTDPPTNPP
jgi:uncharacterized protein DUF222/HNH endonuclease